MYSYQRFTTLGVAGTVAGWALVLSGIYSSLALGSIVAVGGVLSGNLVASLGGVAALGLGVVPLAVGVLTLQYRGVRRGAERVALTALHLVLRRRQSKAAIVRDVQRLAALRLGNRSSAVVALFSTLNWVLDIACLAGAILALDGHVPWQKLVLVWAAGAGASSLHLTPGGLGVVEAARTLALVGAGMPAATAVAAVLLYRAVSFWLVLAAGTGVLCARSWRGASLLRSTSTPARPRAGELGAGGDHHTVGRRRGEAAPWSDRPGAWFARPASAERRRQ